MQTSSRNTAALKRYLIFFIPLLLGIISVVGIVYFIETGYFIDQNSLLNINRDELTRLLAAKTTFVFKILSLYSVLLLMAALWSVYYLHSNLRQKRTEDWLLKLSSAVEQSPNMVMITDIEGSIEYINPRFTEVSGYDLSRASELNPLIASSGRTSYDEIFRTLRSGGQWKGEYQGKKSDESQFWIESTISPIKDGEGNITHFVIVSVDITRRKRVRLEMLRQSMALESTADGIILTDPEGRIEYLNPAMLEITGWSPQQTIGKDLSIIQSGLMSKEYFMELSETHGLPGVEQILMADEFYAQIWKVLQRGLPWKGLLLCKRNSGSDNHIPITHPFLPDPTIYWAFATITPIFDLKGAIIGYVMTYREVTREILSREEIKRQNDELELRLKEISDLRQLDEERLEEINKVNDQLKTAMFETAEAYRTKDAFLANVSHELRTPITGISGMIDMLFETALTCEQKEYAELAKLSANSLLDIVNDILDFSKIESGAMEFESIRFDLWTLVRDMVRTLSFHAKKKRLSLDYTIHDDVPVFMTGDPTRLRQVLLNLLNNAVKFTADGGVTLDISQKESMDNRLTLHFTVADTGIGIPEEKFKSIFMPFSQVDGSTSRRYGGTGLGLTISAQLVERMGGRIWVESVQGEGSLFHFTASFETEPLGSTDYIRPVDLSDELPQDFYIGLRSLNVLITDDNIVNQKLAAAILQKRGHTIRIAQNGREALDLMEKERFDLILMDIQMPLLDGYQTTEAIRGIEAGTNRHIPIIAVTANTSETDRDRYIKAGMDGYIPRPLKAANLFKAIEPFFNMPDSGVLTETINPIHNETGVFDYESALANCDGDKGLFNELIALFLENYPGLMIGIEEGLNESNYDKLNRYAHSLKGSLSHFMAENCYNMTVGLEEIGRECGNIEEGWKLLAGLRDEIDRLCGGLKKFLVDEEL